MDAKLLDHFVASVIENLEGFTGLKAEKKKVDVFHGDTPHMEISSIIGIIGDLSGSAVISFPKDIALKVASGMLMDEIKEINDDTKDAIGEFSNIAFGKARNTIVDSGINIKISPPTIVIGKDHKIFFPPNTPVLEVQFGTEMGDFYIIIGLKEKK